MTSSILPAGYRHLGATDESTVCEKCGKLDLNSTIILGVLDADGNVESTVYYGSTCAARALALPDGSGRTLLLEAKGVAREILAAADHAVEMLAWYDAAARREIGGALRLWVKRNTADTLDQAREDYARITAEWTRQVEAARLLGWSPAA